MIRRRTKYTDDILPTAHLGSNLRICTSHGLFLGSDDLDGGFIHDVNNFLKVLNTLGGDNINDEPL